MAALQLFVCRKTKVFFAESVILNRSSVRLESGMAPFRRRRRMESPASLTIPTRQPYNTNSAEVAHRFLVHRVVRPTSVSTKESHFMYFSQNERRRRSRSHGLQLAASFSVALGLSALAAHPSLANPDVDRVARASVISQSDHLLDQARLLGRQAGETRMQIAFALPLRNQAGLHDLIRRLYDRSDPLYGKYLTPVQFGDRFGASQSDYDAVVAYVKSLGLEVKSPDVARTLIVASGPTSAVEAAFGVNINRYLASDGRIVYANDAGPQVPAAIASRITGIIGLNNLSRRHHTHHQTINPEASILGGLPHAGSGPTGGLAPADIQKAYNLDTVALKGEGQTVALYELDGYNFDDIQAYATQFNLGAVTNVQNVPVDGFTGVPQTVDGSVEVTLDIDMVLALAPNLKNILVYEGDLNNDSAVLDTYKAIANTPTDQAAQIVSTSWGTPEQATASFKTFATTEDGIFQQMATQGQTIFDASGDDGAFDSGIPGTLAVDDPAGHPSVTAVGGTTLTTNADGTYKSEVVWQGLDTVTALENNGGGSGGGVSVIWPIPTWQSPVTTLASKTFRNVPDVALNADSNTGYDIYAQAIGGWSPTGGTSAAAPLWAAFTALINEQRSLSGLTAVGFFNPTIYSEALATTPANNYATLFNDVTTGNNLFYAAGVGYDNATGWGSFKGAAWISAVGGGTGQTSTVSGTVADAGGSPVTTATVTAYLKSNGIKAASATVASDGTYSLTLTSGLAYRFTATAVDYEGQVQSLTVPTTASTLNFTLVPSHLYPTGLQMISAPEDFTNVASISSLLTSVDGTAYTPLMYAWAPYQSEYVGTPSSPADTLRIGQGYWVRFPAQMYLALQGTATPTTSVYHLTLQAGWNMIGDPFPVAVSIPSIQVETLASTGATTISTNTLAQLPLYSYDQTSNAYVQHATDSIQPYVGYWIYASQACQLLITPPGGITPTPPGSPLAKPTSGSSVSYGFKLRPR